MEVKLLGIKQVGVYLLCGGMGMGGGGLGSLYADGQKDQQIVDEFKTIHHEIDDLNKSKVSNEKFTKLEGVLVSIAVNVCKLSPGSNSADCEGIRWNYYNKP